MEALRTHWTGNDLAVQTAVVSLLHDDGRQGTLVCTAHIGRPEYYQALAKCVEARGGTVFFEQVRSRDTSAAHWRRPDHRFLRVIREDLYRALAGVDGLTFQADVLQPGPRWTNADVDCCELADRLRQEGVMTLPYELAAQSAVAMLRNPLARPVFVRALLKYGFSLVALGNALQAIRLFPAADRFQAVINDWRSDVAAKIVLDSGDDFVLIYGAGHAPRLLRHFARAGFAESGREWLSFM